MRQARIIPGRIGLAVGGAVLVLLAAADAAAQITANPSFVSLMPTQQSALVSVTIAHDPSAIGGGTGTLLFQGLPNGVTTSPSPVTFNFAAGTASSVTSFRFVASAAAPPGQSGIGLAASGVNCGVGSVCSGGMSLQILQPSITASASPNPVTIPWGESRPVTVSFTPDPGFGSSLTASFTGFPAGVSTGQTQPSQAPYPPLSFSFAVAAGTPPGTYTGTLVTVIGQLTQKTYPMTVIVPAPDIFATFSQPSMSVCQGGAAAGNGVLLQAASGYVGTPALSFTAVPAGLTVSPMTPAAAPMPPSQTVPFTVQAGASAQAGTSLVTLRIRDANANVDKSVSLQVAVAAPDFTAAVSPPMLSLPPGGQATGFVPAVAGAGCFTAQTITVTPSGAPPGVTFSPPTLVLTAPAFASAGFTVQASVNVSPGTFPLTFTFTPSTGAPRSATGTLTVTAAPDFALAVAPTLLTLPAGTAGMVTVSANGINGFAGTVAVDCPAVAGLTFTPQSFTLPAGGSQQVSVQAAAGATPGIATAVLTGTAAGITGTRTATLSVRIDPPPDFTLSVAPATLALVAGESRSVSVSATPLHGFSGTVSVSCPVIPGVTFTPASFALPAGGSQSVTIQAATTAPVGASSAVFTGTAAAVAGTRTAALVLRIDPPPDFALSISPPALAVTAGSSGQVTVTAMPLHGFAGTVQVTASAGAGVTISPASFSLAAGGSQSVSLQVAAHASPGAATASFSATATGVAGARTASVSVTVMPRSPLIESLTPPALTDGAHDAMIRVAGRDFRPGATATSTSPDVTISRTTVLSPTLADVAVSVRAGAAPGGRRVDIVNADGTRTDAGATLLIYPRSSLAAPLGVTVAAVVHPLPYALVAPTTPVYPRGLLATTGLGTIVGTWLLDGVPFDRFVAQASGGMPVEVRSSVAIPSSFAGEHRLELAIESPRTLMSAPVSIVFGLESHSGLKVLAPAAGEILGPEPPLFRWSLVPGASGYLVEVGRAGQPPLRRRLSSSSWRPSAEDAAEIGVGNVGFRVRAVFPGDVEGEPTDWVIFTIGERSSRLPPPVRDGIRAASLTLAQADGTASEPRPSLMAPAHRDGQGSLLLTLDGGEAPETRTEWDTARGQLTTSFDVASGSIEGKGTGDVGGRRTMRAPQETSTESRNWDLQLATGGVDFRTEARGGWSPPSMLDQSEFLTSGLARGGVQGSVISRLGTMGYYRTTNAMPAGLGQTAFDLSQRIEAVGYAAPSDEGRLMLRTFALRVRDEGAFAGPRTLSEAAGVLGRWSAGPGLQLVFEGAHGRLESADEEDRSGGAFRLGATGTAGRFNYGVSFRRTDAGFINPANPGLTAGGVPDRQGGDLSLSTRLGIASVSFQARRMKSDGGGMPRAIEDSGFINLSLPLGQLVSLNAGATFASAQADADAARFMPETDRRNVGLSLMLGERAGSMMLSQSLMWQETDDRVMPGAGQEVMSANLGLNGPLAPWLTISAMVSGTRTDAGPSIGRMEQLMLSLQPLLSLSSLHLALGPRGTYSRSTTELMGSETASEQYQLVVQWTPPWLGSLLAIEIGTDLSRSVSSYQTGTPGFDRRITATVTVRQGLTLPPPTALALDPTLAGAPFARPQRGIFGI